MTPTEALTAKPCIDCGIEKPLGAFTTQYFGDRKGRRRFEVNQCKPCRARRQRLRNAKKRAEAQGRSLTRLEELGIITRLKIAAVSDDRLKWCTGCSLWKLVGEFRKCKTADGYENVCKVCKPPQHIPQETKIRGWATYIVKKYGISSADYDALLASQANGCAICGNGRSVGRKLSVDHDHATGAVRGLLCSRCNTGIGLFQDDRALL